MKKWIVFFLHLIAVHSMLAQVRVTQKATTYASGAPLVAAFPTSPAANDVLVALMGYYTPDQISPPSGWTLLDQQFGNGPGGTTGLTSYYHVVTAGEANNYTFTGIGNYATMTMYEVAGGDMYHPINISASAASTTASAAVTTPTVTPSVPGTLVLAAVASEATHATGISTAGLTYTPSVSPAHGIAAGFGPVQSGMSAVSATFSLTGPDLYGIAAITILISPAGTTGHAPTAAPGAPYSGVTGIPVNFDGSASSDPRYEPLTYAWSFGDGSSGTGIMPRHVYSTTGNYTVSLSVTNTDGYTSTATTGVSIGADCSSVSTGDFGALNNFVPSPTDAWHIDVTNSPVDPMSNTILVTNLNDLAGSHLHPDFGGNGAYGIPYTVVDSSTAPLPIKVVGYPDESDLTLFPIPTNMPVEGSPGDCASTGDNHAIIFDKKSCVVYEIYQANSCSTSTPKWSAGSTAIWDLTQNEKRPYGMTSVDAAGLSVFEGLVRYDEVAAGVVNHAIRFTAHWTKNNQNGGYFTAPATHAAGIYDSGVDTIEGMRIRLKAGYDISSLTPQAKVIATAMKKYGMILADNGSNLYFTGTSDPRWNDDDLGNLKAIPASAFEVINVPLSSSYTASSSFYPNGPVYDAANHPLGNPPVINSFTASSPTIIAGGSSTLTPVVSGSSYSYIDNVGFIRGPVTVTPSTTTTYTLTSRNAYGTSTAQVTVTVGNPIASTLQFVPVPDQTYGAAQLAISATSNSPGAITYSVLSGPASVLGNTVSLLGIGAVSLQATQAASGNYLSGTATITFNVTAALPTLQLPTVPDQTFGTAPFAISAATNSPGAVTYSIVSGPASVSGTSITLQGVGKVVLEASQAAAGNYLAATTTTSFNVTGATPNLQLATIPDQTFGAGPFAISATSNSAGAITYSVLSGPATVAGGTLTLTGIGRVTLQASQGASGNYLAATAAATFNVTAAVPSLQLMPVADQTFGAPPFSVAATSNSSASITYLVVSGPASVTGNTVTLNGAGRVTLQAAQQASGDYLAATVTTTFNVTAVQPVLQWTAIADHVFGASAFTISATSNSTGTITYSLLSGPATLSGNLVTINGVGKVTIQAMVPAAGNYLAATAATSFNVTAAMPNLQLTMVPTQVYGGPPVAVAATTNATGPISYTVLSGPAAIAGNMLTTTGIGLVTLQATVPAAGNYLAATATTTFNVTAATPTLQWATVPDQIYGAAPFPVFATSNSTSSISFSILNGPAQISGNIVAVNGVGKVTLQAAVPATGNYLAATATTSFNVTAATPTLQIAAVPDQIFGAAPFTMSASSNSTAAIVYSVLSGPATVTGNAVSVNAVGKVTLQATVPAAGDYLAASATTSFSVTPAVPTLQMAAVPDQVFGAAPFAVSASSDSTGVITYSVLAGPATIAGDLVTIKGAGAVTVQAAIPAAGNYLAATTAISFNVAKATPTLQFTTVPDQTFGVMPFDVLATSNSTAAIVYSIVSGPATSSGNLITVNGTGTVTIRASVPDSGNYASATTTTSFNVAPAMPVLRIASIGAQTVGTPSFAVSAVSDSPAPVSWAVLSGPANIAGNLLTVTGAGMVTVQASQSATGTYTAAAVTSTFAVQDFQLALTTNVVSVVAGQSIQMPLQLASANGFSGTVTFTCSVPESMSDTTCSATDAALNPTSTQVDSVLSITTTNGFSDIAKNNHLRGFASKIVVLSLVLPFGLVFKRKRRSWAPLALCLISIFAITGCGASVAVVGTPRGNYNLTLTAKSGTATHTTTIVVTVK